MVIGTVVRPRGAGPRSRAPVVALNWLPWAGQVITSPCGGVTLAPACGQVGSNARISPAAGWVSRIRPLFPASASRPLGAPHVAHLGQDRARLRRAGAADSAWRARRQCAAAHHTEYQTAEHLSPIQSSARHSEHLFPLESSAHYSDHPLCFRSSARSSRMASTARSPSAAWIAATGTYSSCGSSSRAHGAPSGKLIARIMDHGTF